MTENLDRMIEEKVKAVVEQELRVRLENVHLTDENAEKMIIHFIRKKRQSGKKKVSLIEIEYELGIPETQSEKIMNKLQSSGVREVEPV